LHWSEEKAKLTAVRTQMAYTAVPASDDKAPRSEAPGIRTAAVISTGDELVQGRTTDTNSSYIADRLLGIGIEVVSVITVGDYRERIAWAWRRSLAEADMVISTGGLGPTADDLTNETVAAMAGVELVFDQEQADRIRAMFTAMGRSMPENNLRQAMLPAGAVVIPNQLGTAPGYRLVVADGDRRPTAVALPGVPREMKAMLEQEVLPWAASQRRDPRRYLSRTFQTFGMSESALDEALTGVIDESEGRLSFRASFPQISARIMVLDQPEEAERRLTELSAAVRARLGAAVFAEGDATMEEVVGELLVKQGKTLATAESCTGGLIGNRITGVAGSSKYYKGGLVAYDNDMKEKVLGVSPTTLAMFGAVSEETACEMATGARRVTGADIAVATTGIAGPGGGSEDKPVGTVAVALSAEGLQSGDAISFMYHLRGTRTWIKTLAAQVALDWIRRHLLGLDPLELQFGRRVSGRRS